MRRFRYLGFSYVLHLCSNSLLASFTPPPPTISYTDLVGGAVRISEDKWTKDTTVEAVGAVRLTADREVQGLLIHERSSSEVNLNGKLLTVGSDGISFNYNEKQPFLQRGYITSSGSSVTIRSKTSGSSQIDQYGDRIFLNVHINAVIQDHKTHKVGLVMTGAHPLGESGIVTLSGGQENTFTGDVVVEGTRNILYLAKTNGVTSIQGNAYVKSGGRLALANSDQIKDTATVTLSGNNANFSFTGNAVNNSEKIHALVVESGRGIFSFSHPVKTKDNASRTLILDDLIIKDGATLRIAAWEAGRDHFLVRKDSKHLADALKKISIDGWAKNQIYLKDYDKEYWSIEAAPEPATYGAIFGAVGLALWGWRYRKREHPMR